MMVWEIALLILAVTYFMVNTVWLVIQIKMFNKMQGVVSKSYAMLEKIIDKSDKIVDEMLDDL